MRLLRGAAGGGNEETRARPPAGVNSVDGGVKPRVWGLAREEFGAKNWTVGSYLGSRRGDSSGPAGLCGLRKHVTEAK